MKLSLIKATSLLLLFCGFLALAAKASPTTLTITKTADTADGACDADCSLREAIAAAESGETIVFSPLFNTPQTITLTGGQIAINKDLTIAGAGANLLTVSGNNASRIFYIVNNRTVALSGMKLTGGRSATANNFNGGAIYLSGSTLTLTNMSLSLNTARYNYNTYPPSIDFGFGGAIASYNSTLSIINTAINSNDAATSGGGIDSSNGIINIVNSMMNDNSRGAINGSGNQITVTNSSFVSNNGAAIVAGDTVNGGSRLSITNSTITNNSGGISNGQAGILTIERTIISNNSSIGVFNDGAATISKTTINNNSASLIDGAGIRNYGVLNVYDSTISNNTTDEGAGGIFNSGQLTLTNSTISGNSAYGYVIFSNKSGGGIYNTSGGNVILTNSTVTKNFATGNGGGLFHNGNRTITLRNTIVADNLSNSGTPNVSGAVTSQGFNLIGNPAGSSGWTNTDLLNSNPLLAPLANNGGPTLTHRLIFGSPAINAGSDALAIDPVTNRELLRDQRGLSRRDDGLPVDIGAYESNYGRPPVMLYGRVSNAVGRGISNARITLTDINGTVLYAQTNPFGYYRFYNVSFGAAYTINVTHKRHRFNSPQIITTDGNNSEQNFSATQ